MTPHRAWIVGVAFALVCCDPSAAQVKPEGRGSAVRFQEVTDPRARQEVLEQLGGALPDELNIARGKPVKTSSRPEGAHMPECAVDGDAGLGSAWWGSGMPAWFQVDLGKPILLNAVHIFFYWDGKRYYQYTIDVSLDEKTWQTVADAGTTTTPCSAKGTLHLFAPVQAQFVRVNILKNSANQSAHIVELKVYPKQGEDQDVRPESSRGSSPTATKVFVAENGILQLYFAEGLEQLVTIRYRGKWLGSLCCAVAQFERKGLGYKGAGVGSARATVVTKVASTQNDESLCAVEVSAQRLRSEETMRKFEAAYQFTLRPGQNWLESRLLRIKNTDAIPYELTGYFHLLQPTSAATWVPACFPEVAGWVGGPGLLGATARNADDFVLGLRKASDVTRGEIVRKIAGDKLAPAMTWQHEEPALIVFAADGATERALVSEYARIKPFLSSPPAQEARDGKSAPK